jgi:hypothetical protein
MVNVVIKRVWAIGSYGTFWGRRAIGSYGTFREKQLMAGRQPLWPSSGCRRQRLELFLVAGTLGVQSSLRRVFTRAEAMPSTDKSSVFYLERSILVI